MQLLEPGQVSQLRNSAAMHVDVDIKTIDNKLAKRRWLALSCLGGYHIGLARQECKTKGVNDRTPKKIGNRLNRSSQTIQQQKSQNKNVGY